MTNTMTYEGYTARVEYDPRDEIFVGRALGIERPGTGQEPQSVGGGGAGSRELIGPQIHPW